MRKTKLGCTILEGHDVADLPLVSENAEILEAEIEKIDKKASNMTAENIKLSNGSTVEERFVEVDTDIKQLFQSGLDGKNLLETSIKSKGGTVSKQGEVATFNELDVGIQSIETDKTGDATAVAMDILLGKTAYARGNKLVGTMPDNGAIAEIIRTQNGMITVPQGFHNGKGFILAQFTNLIASNIRDGITVGGVKGTYKISKSNLRVETNFDRLVDDGGGYYSILGATFIIAVYARGYYSDNTGCSVNDFNNGSKYATEMYRTGGSNRKGCFQIIDNNKLYDNGNMSFPLQDFLAIYI